MIDQRGVDLYVRDPSTTVLMLGWALDDADVRLWQPHLGPMPPELADALDDPFIIKAAWHARFERLIFRHQLEREIPTREWLDVKVLASYLSLSGSLGKVGEILGLSENAKLLEGKDLIQLFSLPAVPARETGLFGYLPAFFHDYNTHPTDWERFCEYCRQDVRAEREIFHKLAKFPLPPAERDLWVLDQKINDTGIPVELELVEGAARVAELAKTELHGKLDGLTGLENSNSNEQMLRWARGQGYPFNSIGKAMVNRALAGEGELTELAKEVLLLRKELAKTASSKLQAIRDRVSPDGRLRHQYSFMGAGRTGRWAGQDVQLQNLPLPAKDVAKRYDKALTLLRAADYKGIKQAFDSPLDVVGSCIRSVFAAPAGHHFDICDLGAIEPRVLGWISGCEALLNVFRNGQDPYLEFGSGFFKKPYNKVTKAERQISKPAVLGCGYQLSGGELVENEDGDLVRTGLWGYAQRMHVEMTREEAHRAVRFYREKYKEVVECWYAMDRAAKAAIQTGCSQFVGKVAFQRIGTKVLRILLPSGRSLHYLRPRVEEQEYTDRQGNSRTRDNVTYEGPDAKTGKWVRLKTFGGHWVENIVQAIARDILAHGMMLADQMGFELVGHVHDEIIALTPDDEWLTLDNLRECMIASPQWAKDLPLDAAGFSDVRYRKE